MAQLRQVRASAGSAICLIRRTSRRITRHWCLEDVICDVCELRIEVGTRGYVHEPRRAHRSERSGGSPTVTRGARTASPGPPGLLLPRRRHATIA